MRMMWNRLVMMGLTAMLIVGQAGVAHAVWIQDLGRLKGAEQSKLVGMGLVVGLAGTGDGGKFAPAMKSLAQVIRRLGNESLVESELKDAKNVALVSLSSTIPSTGVRDGDRVDVYVSSIGPAKSLVGGRLFLVPMTGPIPQSPVYAFAEGAITIEDEAVPTVGVIRNGAQLTKDVMTRYLDDYGRLHFVLNDAAASWVIANNVASLINGRVAPEGPNVAKAIDPKNIVIEVPAYEAPDPAQYISDILSTSVHPSFLNNGARVVINERTKTIVMTGDVRVSPVVITHKGLTITTLIPEPEATEEAPLTKTETFLAIDPENRGGARLRDLLETLNQLKVDAEDRIAIIREIDRSHSLHAELVFE